jgi:hypothetical protein
VPFLSMDLHALATQLSKVKLYQRLFIEKDLLPEDLVHSWFMAIVFGYTIAFSF